MVLSDNDEHNGGTDESIGTITHGSEPLHILPSLGNGESSGTITHGREPLHKLPSLGNDESSDTIVKGHVPLHTLPSRRENLSYGDPQNRSGASSTATSNRTRFHSFGSLESPSVIFQRFAAERDEISRTVPSSTTHALRERLSRVFSRKIDWTCLKKICKEWIKNPLNMVLLVWMLCVVVSGAILFLVMTGMLNNVMPRKSQRNSWFEVNNQILNALFTLMCLYQHPQRIHHLVLLFRWRPDDISRLRKIYCKNGTYKPNEWIHMMVVISLLNLNCFATYALCGLNLGYKRSDRPAIGVGITISVAIAAPAAAGVHCIVSPLGKDYHSELDVEAQQLQTSSSESRRRGQLRSKSFQKRFSFASRHEQRIVENNPQWNGGVLDFWDNLSVAYLSLFCSFCVFGWNMERLGFGNMYVHIATFLLFCLAPFWIFNLAAINIDNEVIRETLGLTGVFLCLFGLLYGGYWRIQMRKRFNLPPNDSCCGEPAVADCALWLFCCWCTLAQESRTGNFYDIVENKLCTKQTNENTQLPVSSLLRQDGDFLIRSTPTSPVGNGSPPSQIVKSNPASPSRFLNEYHSPGRQLPMVEEEPDRKDKDKTMTPPAPSLIQREVEKV